VGEGTSSLLLAGYEQLGRFILDRLDKFPYTTTLVAERSAAVQEGITLVKPSEDVPTIFCDPLVKKTPAPPSGLKMACGIAYALGLQTAEQRWMMENFLRLNGGFSPIPVSSWFCSVIILLSVKFLMKGIGE
jgi:hypothetical protein